MKIHNFSAGPAILPQAVFREAAEGVLDLDGSGLSVLEISHRSKAFTTIIQEAEELVRELLEVPEAYEVLFLSGGASSQFFMTAMNLLDPEDIAAYVDTGSWSAKAIKEAKLFGQVDVLASSKEEKYTYIPRGYDVPERARYLHITSNNTIFGTQYQQWPDTPVPIVCDMSSDIFSRPLPVNRFGIIYAGAQKNLGPAGVTLVILNPDLLGTVRDRMPTMLDYRTHVERDSMFNTPPVFPIYVSMLNLRWIKAHGGLSAMQDRAQQRADLVYNEIDRNPLFHGPVKKEDRSLMNAVFIAKDPERHNEPFLKACEEAGINGIKGHRSVGGFRASMYNAMEQQSAERLVEVMQAFAEKHG